MNRGMLLPAPLSFPFSLLLYVLGSAEEALALMREVVDIWGDLAVVILTANRPSHTDSIRFLSLCLC